MLEQAEEAMILAMRDICLPTTMGGYVILEKGKSLLHVVVVSYHFFLRWQEDFMVGKVRLERDLK